MNKKLGIIIGVVLVLVAVIAAVFLLKGNKEKEIPIVDISGTDILSEGVDRDNLANRLDADRSEIDAIMDKELTDEQKDKINEIITIDPIPDVVAAVPDDNPNDNKYQVIDKNGVVYDVEVPEEYSNATEEDWENYKRELEEQKAIEELFNKNNTNSNKKDEEVIDSQLEDPEDDGKNAPSEDTPSTGDPQGPTPIHGKTMIHISSQTYWLKNRNKQTLKRRKKHPKDSPEPSKQEASAVTNPNSNIYNQ